MPSHLKHRKAARLRKWTYAFLLTAAAATGIGAWSMTANSAEAPQPPRGPGDPPPPPLEYGEFLARPEELANHTSNEIAKSLRLNHQAMRLGEEIYNRTCAACHGADLKGNKAAHAPDLTDNVWLYSGDDLETGGVVMYPSDIEWTVRYGIRADEEENTRGAEADMLAFDPQYRNQHDLGDYGTIKTVTPAEIGDLVEYVLQLTSQPHDAAKAARGGKLFLDNAKGNCFDCHTEDGTGNPAIGSQNLTRKDLFLYGSDRASILETITKGRRGVMPAFGKRLKPEEVKAVSVFVYNRASKGGL
jgi:cytochrome c oxidase cbb3-type subunit 3